MDPSGTHIQLKLNPGALCLGSKCNAFYAEIRQMIFLNRSQLSKAKMDLDKICIMLPC